MPLIAGFFAAFIRPRAAARAEARRLIAEHGPRGAYQVASRQIAEAFRKGDDAANAAACRVRQAVEKLSRRAPREDPWSAPDRV